MTVGTAAAGDASGSVLIVYDSTGPWGWLGEIYSKQLANLLGHFQLPYEIQPVESYAAGAIAAHHATFYIGSLYNNPLPAAFRQDVLASTRPICWLKYNLWQVAWDGSGSPDPAFESKFGFGFAGLDFTGYDRVLYQGETFTRYEDDPDLGVVTILNPAVCAEMATAVISSSAAGKPSPPPVPYIVHGANLWYVADMPFAYVSEEDRYIVFADLLHDMLGMDHPASHRALIRIEDVDPTCPPEWLREIADYLSGQGIPFVVSVIPVYSDPFGVYNGGVAERYEMSQQPDFLDALRYMVARGGTVNLHGYTHQYDSIENPYNGATADDFEFYRVTADAHGNLSYQGPVAEDSAAWVRGRIAAARRQAAESLLHAATWETPHYTASALDHEVFAANFPLTIGRVVYFADSQPLAFGGQLFPYVIYRDVYGQSIVPENLGNVDPWGWEGYAPRLPDDIIRAARKNLVVRDGWASAYFHPFLDLQYLRDLVTGIRDLGYEFVDLSGRWDDDFPVAEAGVPQPTAAQPGQAVTFDGSASYHPRADRSIIRYDWDWDSDGVYDAAGITASHAFAVPGDYLVALRVSDDGTPAHAATDAAIVHIAVAPVITGFVINDDAVATDSRAVTLSIFASGAAQVRFRNQGGAWSAWRPYADGALWELAAGPEGPRRVEAQCANVYGMASGTAADGIYYDDAAAPPTGAVRIADGADYTPSLEVTLNLPARGAADMRLKHRYADPWGAWQPYAATKTWALAAGGDGPRAVYVQYRDLHGNLSAARADTIFYDTPAPPDLRYFKIQFNAATTPSLEVTLCITADGATHMRFKNAYADAWGPWTPYGRRAPWRLADGPAGARAVYCQCRDSLGNLSAVRADTILFQP